ncbi:MAG TPA: hypothetical protein VMJ10_08175 [Kofleriaceae bacterium]|nr:hypothetical protein [Kofleriaceae bacterium]
MRGLLAIAILAAACGDDHTTTIKCTGGTQGTLTANSSVTAKGGDDLNGAAIAADGDTTVPMNAVTIACASDIVPDGFVALGPAISFGDEGTWSDRAFTLTVPYKAARLPKGATNGAVRIVAQRAGGKPYFPAVSNRELDDKDAYASLASFRALELTTYQVVASADAGQPSTEMFNFNAIIGVSMGGNAAMSIGLRHPDRFDISADLGGEPGPSIVYTMHMVQTFLFGGFCTAASGKLGQLCPNVSTKPEQFEVASDYEHMIYQAGMGTGLTSDRSFYLQAARDLSRALSNPAAYNPANPYAPPGVLFSTFAETSPMQCGSPVVLQNFYDANFNPDGSKPVIEYCDGGDSATLGLGVFDPTLPQTDPPQVLLAVDLNGNGMRDSGEPVITQAYEPWSDVGSDGLADQDEPGYDPVTNPDPDGDDYHYLRNPLGTEGNGNYDPGEPFMDVGLDGIAGTCQAGDTPPNGVAGCYDYGEGNGKWDLSPNVQRWYGSDVQQLLATLTPDQRAHFSMWFDAGIRDFFQASVSANAGVGQAMATGELPFGVYDGFGGIVPGDNEDTYDFTEIDWNQIPKNAYLRYGDPDASAEEINNGDGRHVGTANEIIYRIETAFKYIDERLPDGDRDDSYDSGQTLPNEMFTSPHTGRMNPFSLYLPPGYNDPANASRTYPVVYVLHGYGQQPSDLVSLSAVIADHMVATEPLATRIQKFIMVFPDGRCRPGDGCEEGTFYMDSPLGGPAQMETNLLDLMDYINANYRTRPASMQTVSY